MKLIPSSLCVLLICCLSYSSHAQSTQALPNSGVEYQLPRNDASHPCISDDHYAIIEQRCAQNLIKLGLDHVAASRSTPVPLAWPLRMANGLQDSGYYIISAYVDQDQTTGIKDWNCGTNTYDGHHGTDICTFPYPFSKMDNNQVEVIAAADGIIIDKNDGEFDKNCEHNSTQANYVVLQHADGTFTNYFHMKKNSITSKAIGDKVTVGEYLGVVGSSGDANGPHLHFEVRTANNATAYKDPFAGGCNSLNSTSWWAAQKQYTEPAILKAQVGILDPSLPACPTTEKSNELPCLAPGVDGRFYVFLRDETPGLTVDASIIDAAGTAISMWSQPSTTDHLASIYGWERSFPTTLGSYTFQTKYNNITTSTTFQISNSCPTVRTTGIADATALHDLHVYPNPTTDQVNISGEGLDNGTYTVTLRNLLGQTLITDDVRIENGAMQKNLSLSALPDAMYFLSIETQGSIVTRKMEKRN